MFQPSVFARIPRAPIACAILLALGAVATAASSQKLSFARVFPNPGQIGLYIAAADGTDEHLLLPTGVGIDYDATWSPDGAWIVFTSDRNGPGDLYRVKPDGTGLEQLTNHPAYDDQAAFSPDGKQLVFVSSRETGRAHLWILDLQTKAARALTSGPADGADFRPAWSPDGKWIAFSSDRDSKWPGGDGRWETLHVVELYLVRADGTGLKRLTNRGEFIGNPKWSADGRSLLAYAMTAEQTLANRRASPEPGNDTRLVSVDVATGAITDVTAGPGVKMSPAFVGSTIGYVRKDKLEPGAGIYYADGRAGPKGDVRLAAWSPDGKRVVFHRRLTAPRATFVRTFSRDPGFELSITGILPSFSPTGDRFLTVSGTRNGPFGAGIQVAATSDEKPKVIFEDPKRNVLAPQWTPDGQAILFGIGNFNAFFNGFHGKFHQPADRVEGGAQVALVQADGTGYRELTTGPNNNGFPSMAPDGRRIVYRTFGTEENGLRIMNLETKAVTVLTQGYDNFPLWSPRGDLIVFSRQVDGDYEIYTVRPDTKEVKRLTHARGNDAHMAWSPDGTQVAFATSRQGFKDEAPYTDAPQPYGEIWVMNADGSNPHALTDDQWEDGTPAFQPTPPLITKR